jgi:8-oxo-dGTP diphosphatase
MIEAAGGVVWKATRKGSLSILLIHRPLQDDWSFPKGKLDPGESHREAAVR